MPRPMAVPTGPELCGLAAFSSHHSSLVETPEYLAAAKQAKMTADERDWIVRYIASNPDAGAIIPDTGGARKVRVPKEGQGKSGGYRLVTYYLDRDQSFC